MACMKLNKAIVFGCAGGSVGLAGLYLVNKSELSSFVMGGDGVTLNSIVLVSGAKAIPVDCYKNGAKVVDALRTLDGAAGMEQTVTITVYELPDLIPGWKWQAWMEILRRLAVSIP